MIKNFTAILILALTGFANVTLGQTFPMVINCTNFYDWPGTYPNDLKLRSSSDSSCCNAIGSIQTNWKLVANTVISNGLVTGPTNSHTTTYWYRVDLPGTTSAMSAYCAAGSVFTNPVCSASYITVVASPDVNIRMGAGTSFANVTIGGVNAKVFNGQKFAVLSVANDISGVPWYEIYLPYNSATFYSSNCSSPTGWVCSYLIGTGTLVTPGTSGTNGLPTPNSLTSSGVTTSGATLSWLTSYYPSGSSFSINGTTSSTVTGSSSCFVYTHPTKALAGLSSCAPYTENVTATYGGCSSTPSSNTSFSTTCTCISPPNPPAPSILSTGCGSVTLSNPGSYYWQGTSCGSSFGYGTGSTFTATSSGYYYLQAYNPSGGGCWSGCNFTYVTVPSGPTFSATAYAASCCTCANGSIFISASGGTSPYQYSVNGGSWSSSFFSSATISSLSAGTDSVQIKDATGCLSSALSRTILAPPAISSISVSPSNNVSAGTPVTFYPITSCLPSAYYWTCGGGVPYVTYSISTSNSTPTVPTDNPGYYTVTLYVTNSAGSSSIVSTHYTVSPNSTHQTVPSGNYVIEQGYHSEKVAEPIDLATGSYEYKHTDFNIHAVNTTLNFTRYYSTVNNAVNSALGYGWSHTYDFYVTNQADTTWLVHYGDGHTSTFIPLIGGSGNSFALYGGTYETLTKSGGLFTLTFKTGEVYHFNSSFKLASILDLNGNITTLNYDFSGNLTSIVAPGGRTLTLSYIGSYISSVSDPLGRVIAYNVNGSGNLVSVTDADLGVTGFSYYALHLIHQITTPRGNTLLTNTYDGQNRVVTQTDAYSNLTSIGYTTMAPGDATVTYPDLHTRSVHHDAYFRLTNETDELGFSKAYTYDYNNNLNSFTDENGHTTSYTYDNIGNCLSTVKPLSISTSISYTTLNKPNNIIDPLSHTSSVYYDANGNDTLVTLPNTSSRHFSYYSNGLIHTSKDALGHTSTYTYNPTGDLITLVSPSGTRSFAYDLAGRRTSVTDENGHATSYIFNGNDQVTKITDALGFSIVDSFDADDNMVATTDKNGNHAHYNYDSKDRLLNVHDARGGIKVFGYDNRDNITSVTDANGHTVNYGFDARKQLITKTNSLGTTHYGYDAVGNKILQTDALGNVKHYTFDALNRRTGVQDEMSNTTTFSYTPLGQVTVIHDALGRNTTYSYDAVGMLTGINDPAGINTTASYDLNGNRTSITDPNGHVQNFGYDASNRLSSYTDAAGNIYSFVYDGVGNNTSETKPGGGTVAKTYDAVNRVTYVANSTGDNYTFTYDHNGNNLSMANTTGLSTFLYDSVNHMVQYNDMFGKIVQYNYDLVGNRTKIIYPGGNAVSYAYNNDNMLTGVTDWLGHLTTYNYNVDGRLTEQDYPVAGVKCTYSYNLAGMLTNQTNSFSGSAISSSILTLDATGNITQEQRQGPIPDVHLTADTFAYTYGLDDRLMNDGTTAYANNASGSRTGEGATVYGFTVDNILNSIVTPSVTTTYKYDAKGRRVDKIEGGVDKKYVLDPSAPLGQVLQETNGSGTTTASYIYGLGLIARIDASGNVLYYHFDPEHNTVALSNDTGVTDKYTYEPFGRMIKHTGSTQQPFCFLGQYGVQQETSTLYYVRARYYDAANGRFLSKDPYPASLMNPQTLNRYVYGFNNPLSAFDYSGLWPNWSTVGIGTLQFVAGAGKIAETSISLAFAYTAVATGVGAVWAPSLVLSATSTMNDATKDLAASFDNFANSSNENYVWKDASQYSGIFQGAYDNKIISYASKVNDLVLGIQGAFDIGDDFDETNNIISNAADNQKALPNYAINALYGPVILDAIENPLTMIEAVMEINSKKRCEN